MPCLLDKDQPLRVQTSKGGVIHAGDYHIFGGYTSWNSLTGKKNIPREEDVRTACSWKRVSKSKIVSNKKPITCKNCMKKIGMVEGPVFPDRFVVRRKDTGEFFKNTRSRCSVWADDLTDAWFYKRRGDAMRKIKRVRYVDRDGVAHDCSLFDARRLGYKREVYEDPNMEIKKIRITLED